MSETFNLWSGGEQWRTLVVLGLDYINPLVCFKCDSIYIVCLKGKTVNLWTLGIRYSLFSHITFTLITMHYAHLNYWLNGTSRIGPMDSKSNSLITHILEEFGNVGLAKHWVGIRVCCQVCMLHPVYTLPYSFIYTFLHHVIASSNYFWSCFIYI